MNSSLLGGKFRHSKKDRVFLDITEIIFVVLLNALRGENDAFEVYCKKYVGKDYSIAAAQLLGLLQVTAM